MTGQAMPHGAPMAEKPDRYRFPITAIAVAGFGALVAFAVGASLFLGLSSATENTRRLMASRSETIVDALDRGIEAQLQPVVEQAQWVASQIEGGHVKLDDTQALDTFISGALSATPQVTGIGLFNLQAQIRRWDRQQQQPLAEDWSDRPGTVEWLAESGSQSPAWQAPFWIHALGETVVRFDTPLRINGEYAAMLSQVVSVSGLSQLLTSVRTRTGIVPFILYDRDNVLAHPLLIEWQPDIPDQDQPLVALDALGDAVLERIWSPDQKDVFILSAMTEASASGVTVNDHFHVFLYRDINRYGPKPWTIGAYVNTETNAGDEFTRLVNAVLAGLAMLVVSVAVAAWFGVRASRPIQAIAAAARAIEAEQLDGVRTLPPSRVAEFDDANRSFNQMVTGLQERTLIRETLGRFVPADVAKTLLTEGGELAPEQSEATVLFCDLEGFTNLTETLGPAGIVKLLNEYFEVMVEILERYKGVVTQFQGDAILATFNVPAPDPNHAANALQAALEMRRAVQGREFSGQRLNNRIGIDTGQLIAGAVGAKGRLSYTVHGDAVNLAARLEAMNKELGTRTLISDATAARVEGFDLKPMGKVSVRGQSEQATVYALGDKE